MPAPIGRADEMVESKRQRENRKISEARGMTLVEVTPNVKLAEKTKKVVRKTLKRKRAKARKY